MDEFPAWAQRWLKAERPQVSHGLNLALKLRHPVQMPLMLWDVVVARPQIQQALAQLSFLHFARFVPSSDGTALMVVTEFDGPLQPYVMDFAIALGGVFDRLLSYVEGAPPLPVRDHPDEFWQFVQLWNRVPFLPPASPREADDPALLPVDFDYPLYAAYPDKTMIDIVGSRGQGKLPPALDRPAAWVDLRDVQGNILRGYGARTAMHQFFTVTNAANARRWLAQDFSHPSPSHNAWGALTTAEPWAQAADGKTVKPDLMANVAFSFTGMKALLPGRQAALNGLFPQAFREGAQARAALNGDIDPSDPSEPGPSAPAHWHFGRDDQHIHVVLTLQTFASEAAGGSDWLGFAAAVAALKAAAEAHGLKQVYAHEAQAHTVDGVDLVYFDYKDGITDPRISGQCPVRPGGGASADFQPAASPGEFLLGPKYSDIYGGASLGKLPQDLALNGSFAAMRLIEQHVDTFDDLLTQESARLGLHREQLKAKLMGRWSGGEPLALELTHPPQGGPRNDFDYAPSWEHPAVADDHLGLRCPVGAHIRRSNPRNARVAGQRHARRLIRRGMPSHWQEDGATKRGLLGLFICGSLERQFEFIQQQWIQGDLAASGIRGTQDPIAGLRTQATEFQVWHDRPDLKIKVPPLVATRGSLYLFLPGIAALRGLKEANSSATEDSSAAPAGMGKKGVKPPPPGASMAAKKHPLKHIAAKAVAAASKSLKQSLSQVDLADLTALLVQGHGEGHDETLSEHTALAMLAALPDEIRELLADLLLRGLNSKWVENLVNSFAPPDVGGCDSAVSGVATADIDPTDPWVIAHPAAAFAKLRSKSGNLVWVPAHRAYWVLDLAGAQQLFGTPGDFVQQAANVKLRGIITLDGERHTVVRAAVVEALAIAANQTKLDGYLDCAVTQALGTIGQLQQFDFVKLYGNKVPGDVFWNILGLPLEHREECGKLAQTMMRHFGQPEARGLGDRVVFADASLRLTKRLALLFARALAASLLPGAGPFRGSLIGEIASRTRLVGTSAESKSKSKRTLHFIESLLTLLQFVLAGFMSMQFLMGSALRNLLTPDPRAAKNGQTPWQQLLDQHQPDSPGFEKALLDALAESRRVDPPVAIVQRYVGPQGARIGGVTIPKDCPVFAVVTSAQSDASFGTDPEQFHWDRPRRAQLSLGHGLHECVGSALQDEVVPAALSRLLLAMPGLALCDTEAVPAWLDNLYFRSLQSLPVHRCGPSA